MTQNKLTPKQEKFCLLYVELGNASEAYRRSYNAGKMSDKVIHNKASDLLKKDGIRVRLDELQAHHQEQHDITIERVVQELASIGFANISDFMREGPNGFEMIPLDELPKEKSAAISEIMVTETVGGTKDKPTVTRVTKAKLLPKTPALVKLGEHLGEFAKKVKHTGEVKHTVVDGTQAEVKDELSNIFESHGDASGNSSEDANSVH